MKKGLMLVMLVMSVFCASAQWRGGQGRHCQPYYPRPAYYAPRVGFGGGFGIGFGVRPAIRVVVNPVPPVVYSQPQVVYTQPPPPPSYQPRVERIWIDGHYEETQQGRVWVEGHYIQREVY